MIGYLTPNYALISAFGPRTVRRTRRESLALHRVFKSAPRLADYLRDGEILAAKGPLDRPISGLAIDSRRVAPGNLFFALPGRRADGASFIDEAMSRGAVAVITQQKLPGLPPARMTFIQVADARAALAAVAQRFSKFPDRDLNVVGVTGTSGKTIVTHLVKHFLNGDQRAGLLSSIHYDLGARTVPAYRTTPEALDTFGLLSQMRDAGCQHAVMEVSSHGIEQQRVRGLHFRAAVFTNLTADHLDYHGTIEAYFEVKARLFTGANGAAPKVAVVNLDDPLGERLIAKIPAGVQTVTYGENPRAQVRAERITADLHRTSFRLVWPKHSVGASLDDARAAGSTNGRRPATPLQWEENTLEIESPLVGRFNVSNLLAAIATAWALGRDPVVFLARLRAFHGVPGRLERIDEGQPFNVFVDYAHTDDALRHTLGMLRAITPGKLRVVFGCGGNRDRAKRPRMTRVVQEFADHAYATADNPRTERLAQIFDDMRAGAAAAEKITWLDDRRRAMATALAACQPGDCLLIAGKGHETFQEFADTVVPFDDRQVARELLGLQAPETL